jgi:hypothetical protein
MELYNFILYLDRTWSIERLRHVTHTEICVENCGVKT